MDDRSLGETIRAARLARGSQASLRAYARILEISPTYLSLVERDICVPSRHRIEVVASLFDLDFDDLMAKAGRLSEKADRYMRRHPAARMLLRKIVDLDLGERELRELVEIAERVPKWEGGEVMSVDMKVDFKPEDFQQGIVNAVMNTAFGKDLEAAANRAVEEMRRDYSRKLNEHVERAVRQLAQDVVALEYRERIKEFVRAKVTDEFLYKVINRLWDKLQNDY